MKAVVIAVALLLVVFCLDAKAQITKGLPFDGVVPTVGNIQKSKVA